MTIYKTFVRPHLHYSDVIYDEAYNEIFHQKFESIQYNAYLALSRLENRQEKTLAIIRLDIDVGTENFPYFIRFIKKINQFTFLI